MGVWVREKLRNTLYSAVQAGQRERERKRAFVTLCIVQCRSEREREKERLRNTLYSAVQAGQREREREKESLRNTFTFFVIPYVLTQTASACARPCRLFQKL